MSCKVSGYMPKLLLLAIGLSVLVSLFNLSTLGRFITDTPSLLTANFGGALSFSQSVSFSRLLVTILPFFVQVLLFAEFISADITTVSVYVFSRTSRREKWLFGRLLRLVGYSVFFYAALFAVTIIIGWRCGLPLDGTAKILVELLLTLVAWSTLFVMVIGVLCLKIKPSLVVTIGLFTYTAWIFIFPVLPDTVAAWLVPLVPLSHTFLAAHSLTAIEPFALIIGDRAFTMTLAGSAVYLAAWIAVLAIVSAIWIKRTDFINL
jgi:hypothetical protein